MLDVERRLHLHRAVGLQPCRPASGTSCPVAALPISIWPHAMLYLRPSSEVDLVRPVIAVLGGRVGGRVGPRHVGRDRAVVDDPAEQVLTSCRFCNYNCVVW